MKVKQFQKLLAEYTERTSNVRASNKKWRGGISRIPDEIASKIGCIVTLLQSNIDAGRLCKKDEYLMIYNFQPLHISEDTYLCSLDMVIRSISELSELDVCKGLPLQLVINGTTGEVGNNAYGMVAMEMLSEKEIEVGEGDVPIIYGNYKDYSEPKQRDFAKELHNLQTGSFSPKKEDTKTLKELPKLILPTSVCFAFQQEPRAAFEKRPVELSGLTPAVPSSSFTMPNSSFSLL